MGHGGTRKVSKCYSRLLQGRAWLENKQRGAIQFYTKYFSALLLLYDVTNKTSFDNIRAWLGEIREYAQDDVVIMLLGKF